MRYSSHAQDDGFSIEAQEKQLRNTLMNTDMICNFITAIKQKQVQIQSDLNFKK